jgi:hypothetical protein
MPEPVVPRGTQARVWAYNIPPDFIRGFLLKLGTTFDNIIVFVNLVLTIHNQLNFKKWRTKLSTLKV